MTRLRFAALLEIVLCSGFPTQLAIAGVLSAFGITPFDTHHQLSTHYVFALSLLDAAALVGLIAWFLRAHEESFRKVMFGGRPWPGEAQRGLLQIPIVFAIVVVVMLTVQHALPWLHNIEKNPFEGLIRSPLDALLFSVVAVIGGGVREEVQRAFILHRFEQHLGGARIGLVISSAAFGLGHVIQGRDVAVATAALGAFWGAMYLRRRSIASTVVSHSGFNAAEILRYAVYGA